MGWDGVEGQVRREVIFTGSCHCLPQFTVCTTETSLATFPPGHRPGRSDLSLDNWKPGVQFQGRSRAGVTLATAAELEAEEISEDSVPARLDLS